MSDETNEGFGEQFEGWKERQASGDETAKELFRQISHIAVYLSYDLIDKLQFWEKETLQLPDDEIDKRIPHMSKFLEELKTAYETFSDVDL
jgi:hypothetical protein